VGNLPFSSTEDDLRAAFSEHGAVAAIDVIADRETARPRGFAFVEMEDESAADAADAAISALDGNDFGGRNLRVSEAMERRGGGGGRGGRD
jgi:RNA recognition motif-containing protein